VGGSFGLSSSCVANLARLVLLRSRRQLAIAVAVLVLAVVGVAAATEAARPVADHSGQRARASAAGARGYLAPARAAYLDSRAWRDSRRNWYRQFLPSGGGDKPATMWGIVHLFDATSALAIAAPTPASKAAVRRFAKGAEAYWNPDLRPLPGYGPVQGSRGARARAWYDDDGWWGVAFYDAFRATGDRRYLKSAARALAFVDSGWDKRSGGIYWDNRRTFKASESLSTAALTAAALYRETRAPRFLALAKKYLAWADKTIRSSDGLYGGRDTPENPMPYVQGPMAETFLMLCKGTGDQSYCGRAEELMAHTADRFPTLTMGPQYDSLYIRSVIAMYQYDHNPRWLRIATDAGDRALANAKASSGLYLRTWDGRPITTIGTAPGKLQTHAATTVLLAWLATAAPRG
jgi:hypothetical protein